MTTDTIEAIGHEATRLLLAGEQKKRLREQYDSAETTLERSPTGFYLHFDLPDDCQPIESTGRTIVRGVYATVECLQYDIEFLLFVDDGLISMLEAYTHQEELPTDLPPVGEIAFAYSDGDSPDTEL